jgi:hypothetical protein
MSKYEGYIGDYQYQLGTKCVTLFLKNTLTWQAYKTYVWEFYPGENVYDVIFTLPRETDVSEVVNILREIFE